MRGSTYIKLLSAFVTHTCGNSFGPARPTSRDRPRLIAYLLAVFPAKVYVARTAVPMDDLGGDNPWLRLPFQAVYIAWVLWAVPGALEPLVPSDGGAIPPGPITTRSCADRPTEDRHQGT